MATVIYPAPIFGPVQSRRLGRSLGVNLLPPDGKICSFDCIYCECGLNEDFRPHQRMTPRSLVKIDLEERLAAMKAAGEPLDAITFSGNGEPTSHPDFGAIVDDVRALRDKYYPQAKVCLLTNATHLDRPDVYQAILRLDRPCLKLDTADIDYIRLVDRPNAHYDLQRQLDLMRSIGSRCVIQSMFMKGTWQGKSVDNTGDFYVQPWLKAVREVRPAGVDIYTIARDTPDKMLQKATPEELDRIVALVKAEGIDAHAYY